MEKLPSFLLTLDLKKFKTRKCSLGDDPAHNLKKCPDYHEKAKDFRRDPRLYTAEMCSLVAKKKPCPQGDECRYCHNRVEEFYHPDKYKAKFCQSYLSKTSLCEYGEYCCFAHGDHDISIDLIDKFEVDTDFYSFHYKTVWCPYVDTNHDRDSCVFAHNW